MRQIGLLGCVLGALVMFAACDGTVKKKNNDDDDDGSGAVGAGGGNGVGGATAGVGGVGGEVGMPPYPTGPYGLQAGDTMPDAALRGIADATQSQAFINFSLGDFYNPSQSGSYPASSAVGQGPLPKVLVVIVCSVWVGPCNFAAADSFPVEYATYSPQGAQFLMVLHDSSEPGVAAVEADVLAWATKYSGNFPTAYPVNMQPLAVAAYPTVLIVDTQNMEVLHWSQGVPQPSFWQQLQTALQ